MSRDYKDEYKKFQKHKSKYRAKLNKFNRKQGTYGNGDGKDASHSKGKITGFVESSKNKGKKEKSRLKGSKRKKYNKGGKAVDDIPALLTENEYVITAESAQKIGYDNLDYMNKTGKLPTVDARKRRKKNAKSRG
tara:strand:+ start:774 stop:1178 length:405 start_codon:yes stop_codon:yes gene_type:complete